MGLAIVIIVLDTTLLNVSLGTIVRELKTDISSLQWVITAYSLTLAALTITGGRLGDLFGRRKMFITGAIIFALGSFIASISPNVGWLIIGESLVEGIGAALMMPATASLLVSTYSGKDRAIALGVWGGMAAAGSAIGPILGGWLTSEYSWRWGFRINIFVAAILVLGAFIVKEARDKSIKPDIDWIGVLLTSTGLFSGVFAIIQGSQLGWITAVKPLELGSASITVGSLSIVPFAGVLSVILLTAFFFWEEHVVQKSKTPLVSMKLFTNKQFTSGAITTAITSLGQIGLIFALPVYLQGVKGLDSLHTGYAMLPLSISMLIVAPLGGVLSQKFMPKRLIQTGLGLNVIALVLLRQSISLTTEVTDLILPLTLYGAGMGLVMSQISNMTLSAVPPNEAGEASGVNNTLRQVGSSLGSAIIGSVLVATLTTSLAKGIQESPVILPANKTIVSQEVSAQASAVEFGGAVRTSTVLTDTEQAEIKRVANASTINANRTALLFTVGFTFLGFLAASQLPKIRNVEQRKGAAAH